MHKTLRVLAFVVMVVVQALSGMTAGASPMAASSSMDPGLYQAYLEATRREAAAFTPTAGGFSLEARGLQTNVNGDGLSLAPATRQGWTWNIELDGLGREGQVTALSTPEITETDGRSERTFNEGLTEWFRSSGIGLEQGFDVNEAPRGNGRLVLRLQLDTSLSGVLSEDGRSLRFDAGDGQTLRYDGLRAFDAQGTELDAKLVYTPKQVLIRVDDRGAAYPITIDPFIYLEQKVISPINAPISFGYSVALSGDTALVGAPDGTATMGAAYVFTRTAAGWILLARLSASDATSNTWLGKSVALSGDTALIGVGGPPGGVGAAYIFVKPASGWATTSTFTAKLTPSDGASADYFGLHLAISGDTVLVGAQQHSGKTGAAYVFVKPVGGWVTATETAKLTASDGLVDEYFGNSVDVEGDTAVVGAFGDNSAAGAIYVFVKPGGGWATGTETAKLTTGGSLDLLGRSVAISGDTILAAGGRYAYVFVKPEAGWTTASAPDGTIAVEGDGGPGAVALSGDLALVGDGNAVLLFVKPNGGWPSFSAIYAAKLTSSVPASTDLGYAESFAVTGDTILVGARSTGLGVDAAYFYDPYADYAVAAAYSVPTANPGDTVFLLASVTNFGPTYADFDLAANVPMPAGLTYLASSAPYGSYDPATGVWSIGTFPYGVRSTLTIAATVNATPPLTIPFNVSLTASDLDNSNNSDTAILATTAVSGVERLSNGGFNTYAGTSLVPTGWVAQGFGPRDGKDTHVSAEGTASVRMDGQAGQTKYILQVMPTGGVAGDSVNLTFKVATRAVPVTGMCLGAVLLLNGAVTVSTTFINCPTGTTNAFIPRTLRFAAPVNYTAVVVVFLYAKGGGTVWIDAASLLK